MNLKLVNNSKQNILLIRAFLKLIGGLCQCFIDRPALGLPKKALLISEISKFRNKSDLVGKFFSCPLLGNLNENL